MLALFGFVIGFIICFYAISSGILMIICIGGLVGKYKIEEIAVITIIEIIGIGGMVWLFNNAPFNIHMN
jgi:hypothetical protein